MLAFDTGPANAPINDLVAERLGLDCDRDGALARQGRVEDGALELFLDEGYFLKVPPKSLDRNDFSLMLDLLSRFSLKINLVLSNHPNVFCPRLIYLW